MAEYKQPKNASRRVCARTCVLNITDQYYMHMMVDPARREKSEALGGTGGKWGLGKLRLPGRGEMPDPAKTSRPARKRRLYLANAFGFAESGRYALDRLSAELESLGVEVWEPFAKCAGLQPREIGRHCLLGIRESDGVFAVVNGNPPDEGIMVEVGYACALGKPVFLFRDDKRICADTAAYPLNIMVYAGLPDDWRSYWYTGVDELGDTNKALARWAWNGKHA